MSQKYSDFEKQMILTWAHVHYAQWLKDHPDADLPNRTDMFSEYISTGILLVAQFRNLDPGSLGL